MVDILLNLLQYSTVSLVSSTDAYGTGASTAFQAVASSRGVSRSATIPFSAGSNDFESEVLQLQRSGSRVVVLFCHGSDGARFMHQALEAGVGGDGYVWMVGDGSLSDANFWTNETARLVAFKGLFALRPSAKDGSEHDAYLARRRQLPLTSSVSGQCSEEKDDDGKYLWQQDHDNDPITPNVCADDDPQQETSYDAFAYDTVFAVAHALHHLIEDQHKPAIVGSELLEALATQVGFNGITGLVDFHDASADPQRRHHGDRRVGFHCTLVNYVDNTQGLVPVGQWTPCSGGEACSWAERWQSNGRPLTYSTADNRRPPETASCTAYGTILSEQGTCVCDSGFEFDTRSEGCILCLAGRDSRREDASLNQTSSLGCTMCADGYYRPGAHLSASACTTCADISGVRCHCNATVETLDLNPKYWRLSTLTTETYRCKEDGDWSPCKGGMNAGEVGDGYCKEGYRGPRCEVCDGRAYQRYFDKLDARCHECGDMSARTAVLVSLMFIIILAIVIGGSPAGQRLTESESCSAVLQTWRYAGHLARGGDAIQDQGAGGLLPMHLGDPDCLQRANARRAGALHRLGQAPRAAVRV
jgi:hypothetical protein